MNVISTKSHGIIHFSLLYKRKMYKNQRFCILWVGWSGVHDKWFQKQVDPRNNPIAKTHIVDRVRKLSVGVGLFEPAVVWVIGKDLVTNVLENSRVELSLNSLYPLNMNTSKEIVIGSACKSVGDDRNTLSCIPPDRKIRNHIRIGTRGVNQGIFSPCRGKISSFYKWTWNIEPFDTSVHGSETQRKEFEFLMHWKIGSKKSP